MTPLDRPSLALAAKVARSFRSLPELSQAPLLFKTALRAMARNWEAGRITFVTPQGGALPLQGRAPGPDAVIQIRDYRFIRRALFSGDIGFAEAYMAGEWDTPDLTAVLSVFALNFEQLKLVTEGAPLAGLANRLFHALNANTRKGSRKNIHAHYDLGNAFYSRWLDPSMTYSSARFDHPGQALSDAQRNKYKTLAQEIDLRADHHVLEIGCGWGGFAEYAAKAVGARVTGVTISQEQYEFARQRMFDQGLAEKVDIRLVDYRDIQGQFDRVASIEMFEAVGERYWPTYFDKIREVLAPGGRAGLQIITIQDRMFEEYRRRADFIQRYIFPGGMLPSEARLREETERAGLAWTGISRFGRDYADTLAAWRKSFDAAWDDIKRLGFDERFRRLWRFYLCYCDAGFRTGRTDVVQLGLIKA